MQRVMATEKQQQVFTEDEAAEYLRLTKRHLATERKLGRLQCSRVLKGRIRYTLADLQDYLNRDRTPVKGKG